MADIKTNFNTAGTATITLASLANGSGRASTAIDNSTGKYVSADIRVKITTSATSAAGYVSVYLIRSEDGTNYEDPTYTGTDAAYTNVNALLLGTVLTPATATYARTFDTAELGLTLPAKWAIGIVNSTGNTLNATAGNHSVTIREKFFTVN
jgi:hypothetical protein